jgi:hypothetical protein
MRNGVAALIAVVLAGVGVLVALGLTRESSLAYTLGVQPQVALPFPADMVACQGPIPVPRGDRFDRVVFYARDRGEPPASLEVSVREADGGRVLGRTTVRAAGRAGVGTPPPALTAAVGGVTAREPLQVCFENRGRRQIELWGSSDLASGPTTGTINGSPAAADIALVLERDEASILSLLPEMAERASLFRARWLSPAAYTVLGLLVLVGVPVLLVLALRAANIVRE